MTKPSSNPILLAVLASALATGGACGAGKTTPGGGSGGVRETGGAMPGGGGTVGEGGTVPGSGGAGGTVPGSGGAGGTGPGSQAASGSGGGGSGGSGGSGGIIALDAGCTSALCATDAAPRDSGPPACGALTTSTDCDVRKDCHSVFLDPHNCTCTEESCCMRFDHCADGETADCMGPAVCKSMPPDCESRFYTVGFANGCHEGCVRKHECTVPACPARPPTSGTSCGPVDHPCIYDDCAGQGHTQATCANGTWSVQTTACGALTCEGVGVTPAAVTCAAGQVCVRTSVSNVVPMIKPTCVDNTCGTSAVSIECLAGLSGACKLEASTTGAGVYCVMPSPCGGAGGCSYTY